MAQYVQKENPNFPLWVGTQPKTRYESYINQYKVALQIDLIFHFI